MIARAAIVAVVLVGCVAATDRDPCDGPAPAIETCQVGVPFAACGGSGTPRFACASLYDCRWFVDGCVAVGYATRPCPTRDAYGFAQAWGAEPWDAFRERGVDVVLAPTSGDPRPALTCVGPAFPFACPDPMHGAVVARHAVPRAATFVIGYMRSIGGMDVSVELLTDEAGTLGARVCTVPYDDGPGFDTCATSPRGRGHCAVAGTATLSAIPTTDAEAALVQLDVSATFADGSTLEMRL